MAAELTDATAGATRLDGLTSWHADWRGLRVAVLGLGVTGFAVADTLAELGAEVTVFARDRDDDRARILDVIGVRLVVHPLDEVPADLAESPPSSWWSRPASAPTIPCSGGRRMPACRCGATSSWPGACATR